MNYKFLNGFSTSLTEKLNATDGLLPITNARELAERLGDKHSYLVINDGSGARVICCYRIKIVLKKQVSRYANIRLITDEKEGQ